MIIHKKIHTTGLDRAENILNKIGIVVSFYIHLKKVKIKAEFFKCRFIVNSTVKTILISKDLRETKIRYNNISYIVLLFRKLYRK